MKKSIILFAALFCSNPLQLFPNSLSWWEKKRIELFTKECYECPKRYSPTLQPVLLNLCYDGLKQTYNIDSIITSLKLRYTEYRTAEERLGIIQLIVEQHQPAFALLALLELEKSELSFPNVKNVLKEAIEELKRFAELSKIAHLSKN